MFANTINTVNYSTVGVCNSRPLIGLELMNINATTFMNMGPGSYHVLMFKMI